MEPGLYYLRASPALEPIGGMFATSEGPEQIVRIAPMAPEFEDRQIVSGEYSNISRLNA